MLLELRSIEQSIKLLLEHRERLTDDERQEVAGAFEDALLGFGPAIPQREIGPLARALAQDENSLVRKKVANVLHLLEEADYEAILPILAGDSHASINRMAQRAKIRRWKAQRHQHHVGLIMTEVAKVAKEFDAGEKTLAAPDAAAATPPVAGQELVTLVEFMERYCAPANNLPSKSQKVIKAAWHGRLKKPPAARPRRRGQAYRFKVADLWAIWPQWLAAGMPLPELRNNR